jgi:hypothetical protein
VRSFSLKITAHEQDEKDSSIWSDEDVEEQAELGEIEDAQDDFKDVGLEVPVDIKYMSRLSLFC